MHRAPLLDMLGRYIERFPDEREMVGRIQVLVGAHQDCFERHCHPGHVTGSAFILSPDHGSCLLTHHKKLDRWLQLGGHADGQHRIEEVAMREAEEESGMRGFLMPRESDGSLLPMDVDVHVIPARGSEPEHEHHDLRFLLIAPEGQRPVVSDESHELAWVELDRLEDYTDEDSVLRLRAKARTLLG